MSEQQVENQTAPETTQSNETSTSADLKLDGIFAFKLGMSSVYTEEGEMIPVTVLKLENWKVTQVKTKEKDGYTAVQIAMGGRRAENVSKAVTKHSAKANLDGGTYRTREIRMDDVSQVQVGQVISLESLQKGDVVKVTSKSKGRGFSGAMRRWNFAGGPASHGSKFHRRPGSAGTRTWPGFVLPGKRGPGHYGDENVSVRNVQVVGVNTEMQTILVKGPVPGARNTMVRLLKQQ